MNAIRFRLAMAPLFLFALLFPILAFDVALRLLGSVTGQEVGNLVLLLFYEITRGAWGVVALALAGVLAVRAGTRRDLQALACFLVFASIAYGMYFGSGGYAGHLQERLARSLWQLGLSREAVAVLFAFGLWPSWLAMGALVRFAVLFPQPLTAAAVRASGMHDRAGVMRSVPGAGLDMGALFRTIVARGLDAGWFNASRVLAISCAGAAASVLLRNSGAIAVMWLLLALGVAFAVTAMRAAWSGGNSTVRRQLARIGRSALVSLVFFVAAGVVGGVIRTAAGAIALLVLMTLAPAPLLVGLAGSVLTRGKVDQTTKREESNEAEMDAGRIDDAHRATGRGAGTTNGVPGS